MFYYYMACVILVIKDEMTLLNFPELSGARAWAAHGGLELGTGSGRGSARFRNYGSSYFQTQFILTVR